MLLPGRLPGDSGCLRWESSWRDVPRPGDANGTTGECLGLTVLSLMILAVRGIKQNPDSVVEVENTVGLMCWLRQDSDFRKPV